MGTKKKVAKKATAVAPTAAAARMPRRAIYIDIENSSNEAEILRVLHHLEIDRTRHRVELAGVGNWKALGLRYGRTLARMGATLLHTAPPAGVRDWSDLWIAVTIGRWLGQANPGDILDIVSDDRAFDAVADAAADAGVVFHRLSYRSVAGRAKDTRDKEPLRDSKDEEAGEEEESRPRRPRRGRRRRPISAGMTAPVPEARTPPSAADIPIDARSDAEDHHAATEEQIRDTLRRMAQDTGGWVNLDALANRLRAEGFTRPPGSLRLLTRLKHMGDVEILPNGLLQLRS